MLQRGRPKSKAWKVHLQQDRRQQVEAQMTLCRCDRAYFLIQAYVL